MRSLSRTKFLVPRSVAVVCILTLAATTLAHAYLPGTQVWTRRYSTPRADGGWKTAADAAGNIYVAGESVGSTTGCDFLTLKYAPSGTLLWARRYASTGKATEAARGLAVTPAGIVYVTGTRGDEMAPSDCILLSYTTGGRLRWAKSYRSRPADNCGGEAVTVDASGNPVVVGTAGVWLETATILTIKYDSAGNRKWLATYGGGEAEGNDIAVDAARNIYVTGSAGTMDAARLTTISYNPTGTRRWVNQYSSTSGDIGLDMGEAIALEGGYVYVVGDGMSARLDGDLVTVKYSTAGNRKWVARYDGPARDDEFGWDIAVKNGNVYVAGETWMKPGWDGVVVKYNAVGAQQWVSRYSGPVSGGHDTLWCIAVNDSEAIYASGWSEGGSGAGSDFVTMKIRAAGPRLWVKRYNGPGKADDEARAMVLSRGSAYVTGYSPGSGTADDVCTIKYAQ